MKSILFFLLSPSVHASKTVRYIHPPDDPVVLQLPSVDPTSVYWKKHSVQIGFPEVLEHEEFDSVQLPKKVRYGKCTIDGVDFLLVPVPPGSETDASIVSGITVTLWNEPGLLLWLDSQVGQCRYRLPGGDIIETHFVIVPAQP